MNVRKIEDGDGDGGDGGDDLGIISGSTHGCSWISIFHLENFWVWGFMDSGGTVGIWVMN